MIVHEMFHAFQISNNESRFPSEIEAVKKYQYIEKNPTLKTRENELIITLLNSFDYKSYQELLRIKKYRYTKYPYEYLYESAIEQIEGTANYVELETLKKLSYAKYEKKLSAMTSNILDCRNLFPIRIISYDIGALCLKLLIDNNIFSFYSFTDECFNVSLINNINYIEIKNIKNETIINEINKYQNESKEIVEQALAINDVLLMGDYGLVSVNVYNARFYDKYLISTFFLAYEDNETHVMNGNFVIEIENDRIKKVYKF